MNLLDTDWLESAREKRFLIGVSGGRDSVALLHACVAARLTELFVVHVNHELRGEESEGDADFVRELASHYHLPCSVSKRDVQASAIEEKKSIELSAREARHRVFAEKMAQHDCTGVLLAHHADDQAETVLFNLLRGSAGLRGMQKKQRLDSMNITLYRPILEVSRADINDYISRYQLEYREDSSNADDFATRNRIRNEVMPLLEEIMGRKVAPALSRALNISDKKDSLLKEMFDYNSLLDPQGRLHLPSLGDIPTALQEFALHRYLKEQEVSNISKELIESAVNLLDKSQPAKINLPQGRFLRRSQQRVFIE